MSCLFFLLQCGHGKNIFYEESSSCVDNGVANGESKVTQLSSYVFIIAFLFHAYPAVLYWADYISHELPDILPNTIFARVNVPFIEL
jgi:hypothetical protein